MKIKTGENDQRTGSITAFDENWQHRVEGTYNHWTRGLPSNQIQLAFRKHWQVFSKLIQNSPAKSKRMLEVGCGRASLGAYFADDGWKCELLDSSSTALEIAESIFARNSLEGNFVLGDATNLPYPDNSFDLTVSIGLLEHFENVREPIAEQLRVLKPGGWFIGYIVPERPTNLQRHFNWINRLLKTISGIRRSNSAIRPKDEVFRSDLGSDHYLNAIEGLEFRNVTICGMYSMPMISHSPEFPFSLLPGPVEWILTRIFAGALLVRTVLTGKDGWICNEDVGQAFMLAFQKNETT